jgi:hypothetical protein
MIDVNKLRYQAEIVMYLAKILMCLAEIVYKIFN